MLASRSEKVCPVLSRPQALQNIVNKPPTVNGHIESQYSVSTGQWSPLRFVADPYIRIHGMAPALNYGVQAYEGLKAFRTPDDAAIQIFRPDRNALRLTSAVADLGTYTFHKHAIHHHFCPNCGMAPFSESADGSSGASINVRCLDGVDLSALEVKHYDGLHR